MPEKRAVYTMSAAADLMIICLYSSLAFASLTAMKRVPM